MLKVIASKVGSTVLDAVASFGDLGTLFFKTVSVLFSGKWRLQGLIEQVAKIGVTSQPVVLITGAFTGAVLEAQSLFQLAVFHIESAGGVIVAVGMFRELGPVITGLMIAGRVGSAMAAEIGTMKVTDQISALESMNVDPVDYLVKPRFIAMIISMPILMLESVLIGVVMAYIVAVTSFNVDPTYWLLQMDKFIGLPDLYVSVSKSLVFGMLITIVSCFQGLRAKDGAVGVGLSTMRAMVYSAIGILIVNFLMTMVMNQIFPIGLVH